MHPIELTPTQGGWLHADWGDGRAWVRFGKDKHDRLTRIVELHISDPSPENLRRIPLRRIHAAATMRGAGLVQLMLALGFTQEPQPGMLAKRPSRERTLRYTERHRLTRPPGKRLEDDFYRDVAHSYQSAVAVGLQPRKALVEDTGVADATAAGWIVEARRRGHLPPTKPGRARG